MGAPRFKSRKDTRQSIRFTANARWSITGKGRLNLPKIGAVKVTWSRTLPTTPSSVTVIKDAAGRYFASFVIDTDPTGGCRPDARHRPHHRHRPRPDPLRRPVRRHEDRLPALPAPRGEEAEEGPAGTVPQTEGKQEPRKGPPQGRPRPRQGHRRPPRVPPPALHQADLREPRDRRGRPVGGGTGTHQAGQVRPRRRMVLVREHAGVQSGPVRPHPGHDRPVRADELRSAPPAASKTGPNPSTSGNGPVPPAAPSTTGTTMPRST